MPPICDAHHGFMVRVGDGFVCPRCQEDTLREWKDEEADVNDYKLTDHIYPRLHGTGGIGPGTWKRHGLAERQETAAMLKRVTVLTVVRTVRAYDHFGVPTERLIDRILSLL